MPAFAVLLARHRSWVLAAAALLGLAAAGGLSPAASPHEPAQPSRVASIVAGAIPTARAAVVDVVIAANDAAPSKDAADAASPAEAPAEPAPAAKPKRKRPAVGITIDDDEGKVRVDGIDGTREYDSFESFVERAPWIAGLVFMVTFLVFVTPIVIAALVIWYKVRKSRMMNETMLRLAEKGVVPPPEAFDAISGNRANPMGGPATAPLYEQAKAVRQKAVWSDLRKGIIVGAVGLGFTFYSMLDDGSPNFVGLVLLFVGLAYIVLWYFEDRQITAARGGLPPPPPPPPSA